MQLGELLVLIWLPIGSGLLAWGLAYLRKPAKELEQSKLRRNKLAIGTGFLTLLGLLTLFFFYNPFLPHLWMILGCAFGAITVGLLVLKTYSHFRPPGAPQYNINDVDFKTVDKLISYLSKIRDALTSKANIEQEILNASDMIKKIGTILKDKAPE